MCGSVMSIVELLVSLYFWVGLVIMIACLPQSRGWKEPLVIIVAWLPLLTNNWANKKWVKFTCRY